MLSLAPGRGQRILVLLVWTAPTGQDIASIALVIIGVAIPTTRPADAVKSHRSVLGASRSQRICLGMM